MDLKSTGFSLAVSYIAFSGACLQHFHIHHNGRSEFNVICAVTVDKSSHKNSIIPCLHTFLQHSQRASFIESFSIYNHDLGSFFSSLFGVSRHERAFYCCLLHAQKSPQLPYKCFAKNLRSVQTKLLVLHYVCFEANCELLTRCTVCFVRRMYTTQSLHIVSARKSRTKSFFM